jgi:hypothetical protein
MYKATDDIYKYLKGKFKNGGAYYDDSRDAWVSADGTVGSNGPAYANGGEYMELDLTPEEIQEYAKGGFIVEDISIPSLNQKKAGGISKLNKFIY